MARAAASRGAAIVMLLAAVPSCITSNLWSDNRTRRRVDDARVQPLPVVDTTRAEFALVFDAGGTALAKSLAAPATDSAWVRLEPIAHGDSLRTVLARGDERRGGSLQFLLAPAPGVERFALRLWLGSAGNLPDGWVDLPGVRQRWGLKGTMAELIVPCQLATAPSPSAEWPAAGFHRFYVEAIEVVDDDHPTVVKVLLTPVTVLLDVLIAPFELLTIGQW